MGAQEFTAQAKGKTAQEAFRAAVKRAQYDYGHAGYSGTIAEKDSFTLIPLPPDKTPEDYAYELMNKGDPRVDSKWGPAGCFDLGKGEFYFFGWASS